MTKLKCWKKANRADTWKKGKEDISVRIIPDKNPYYTVMHTIFGKRKKVEFGSFIYNNPSKSQALKFANKYMKNHDKC